MLHIFTPKMESVWQVIKGQAVRDWPSFSSGQMLCKINLLAKEINKSRNIIQLTQKGVPRTKTWPHGASRTEESYFRPNQDLPVVSAVGWEVWVKCTKKSGNGGIRCTQGVSAKQSRSRGWDLLDTLAGHSWARKWGLCGRTYWGYALEQMCKCVSDVAVSLSL